MWGLLWRAEVRILRRWWRRKIRMRYLVSPAVRAAGWGKVRATVGGGNPLGVATGNPYDAMTNMQSCGRYSFSNQYRAGVEDAARERQRREAWIAEEQGKMQNMIATAQANTAQLSSPSQLELVKLLMRGPL